MRYPFDGDFPVTSPFGPRIDPITGASSFHSGCDWGLGPGTPLLAVGAGVVIAAARENGAGNHCVIRLDNPPNDHAIKAGYMHMQDFAVSVGWHVDEGQLIGWSDTTGRVTGPHLHFWMGNANATDSEDPVPLLSGGAPPPTVGVLDMLIADVSGWQGDDLRGLPGDGFEGVIIKAAEGLNWQGFAADFDAKARSAASVGLRVIGGYNFVLDGPPGDQQCDAALAAIGSTPIDRVVLDAEVPGLGRDDEILPFGRRALRWNPNVKPILYGSESFLKANYAYDPEITAVFDLWYAQYDSYAAKRWPSHAPAAWAPWFMRAWVGWQFTSAFPSSLGAIDASVFDRVALLGTIPAPKPVPEVLQEEDMELIIGPRQGAIGNVATLTHNGRVLADFTGPPHNVYGIPESAQKWLSGTLGAKFVYLANDELSGWIMRKIRWPDENPDVTEVPSA